MHPKFTFEVDQPHDLVRIVLTGMFTPNHVAPFFEARRKALDMLLCAPGRHITLTDLRAMKILPKETVTALTELLADPAYPGRRLAFVISPSLVQNQLVRMLAGRNCRFFADPAEAEAWLLEDELARPMASTG